MNLPSVNKQISIKIALIILGAFILIGVAAIFFFFLNWQKKSEYEALTSNISAGEGVQVSKQTKTESALDPITEETEETEETVINTISTGEVHSYKMEDSNTGEYIADASVLVVVAKDNDGSTKTIEIVLQIFPVNNHEVNIFPAVLQTLSLINSTSFPDNKVSNAQLEEFFPRGSEWSFFPLIDPFSRFPSVEGEAPYAEYSKKYYGKNVAPIKEFLESGLTKDYNRPLLIIGMEMP